MKKKSYLPLVLVGLFLLALCVFAATPELWVYGSGQMQDSTPYPVETQNEALPYPPQSTATPAVTIRPFQQNYELVIGGIILLAIILFGVIKFPVHKKS